MGASFMRRQFGGRTKQRSTPSSFREAKPQLTSQALAATRQAGQMGQTAESEFWNRSMAFDPQAAAEESARGIAGSLSMDLQKNLQFAQGQAVGAGRLDTGFFDEDRGYIMQDFNQRLSNAIAQQAMQAQQLNLQNIGSMGQFGQNVQNRFTNMLSGSLDRAQAEENAKKQGGGLFGKILGGVGGLVLPGVGSAVGEWIGNKINPGG